MRAGKELFEDSELISSLLGTSIKKKTKKEE
jgi:hypothetical protein